uniref:Uncharacterized protein n=1 Tax=Globisporangium ultimum (strain ATCC 200006 / CBS 805.95 / DAOM BR144) TaxID=431595 RepID=K3X7M2_GLOUD
MLTVYRLLAAFLAALVCVASVQSRRCELGPKTLSFRCAPQCADYEPCIATNVSSSRGCSYECFPIDKTSPSTYKAFTFLVPYGAWKSEQELSGAVRIPASRPTQNDALLYPSKSNDKLTWIDKWNLPNTTSSVHIRGGSNLAESIRGLVANVEIASDFLSNQTQVNSLVLANLNLVPTIDHFHSQSPSS